MTFHAPWDQPGYRKRKRTAKKKAARKKTKIRAKAARPKAKADPKAKGRKRSARGARIVVSKAELDKIRRSVARPRWIDLLPEGKRKIFTHKGKTYWPLYSLLYVVDAVEVVPLGEWSGPTNTELRGSLLRPGFVKKIGSRKYVYVEHAQFIQNGSPIDV